MSLGSKIPIELSEARAARIARGLFEKLAQEEFDDAVRPEGNAWHRFWALGATVAVVAAVVAFDRAHTHLRWPSPWATAEANPSRVVTGAMGSHLAFGDISIDVRPESELVASGDDDTGMLVVLDRGSITCDVAPRGERPPVFVQAGGVRIRVVGTRFAVTRDGEDARVNVIHGTVEVDAHGATTRVSNGQSWPFGQPNAANGGAIAPSTFGAPGAEHPGTAAGVFAGDVALRRPPAKSSGIATATALPRALGSHAAVASPRATAPVLSTAVSAASPAHGMTSPPPDAAQQLFEQAAELEGRDPDGAIAIYRKVAAGPSAWAANALFAEASLEQARGDRAEARRLLQAYLVRYPEGPNAHDARTVLERMK